MGPLIKKKAQFVTSTYDERHRAKTITDLRGLMGKIQSVQAIHQSLTIRILYITTIPLQFSLESFLTLGDTNIAEKVLGFTQDIKFRNRLECEQGLQTSFGPAFGYSFSLALLAEVGAGTCLKYIEQLLPPPEAQHFMAKAMKGQQVRTKQPITPLQKDPAEVYDILRYLCLYSLTCNGLPQNALDYAKREIFQKFGYRFYFVMEELATLGMLLISHRLTLSGMLKLQVEPMVRWSVLSRELQLIVEEVEEENPDDIAYVYSGYAPLSCRSVKNVALLD